MDRYSHKKQRELTPAEAKEFETLQMSGFDTLRRAHEIWMRQYMEVDNRKESEHKERTNNSKASALDANRNGHSGTAHGSGICKT
jgi:hypothetical protein